MEGLHKRAPARGNPGTTPMRPTGGTRAAEPGPKTPPDVPKLMPALRSVTTSPQLFRRTIVRDVIIGGRSYVPGNIVFVTRNTLRQLIDEFAVDPRERA